MTDKRLEIIFNFPLDYRVDVRQYILDWDQHDNFRR